MGNIRVTIRGGLKCDNETVRKSIGFLLDTDVRTPFEGLDRIDFLRQSRKCVGHFFDLCFAHTLFELEQNDVP